MATEVDQPKPPKPAIREKGYVADTSGGHSWPQWVQDERVPDLQWPESVETFARMLREDSRVSSLHAAISLPIRRTPWRVASNGARDEVTEFVAKNLNLPIEGGDNLPQPTRTKGKFSWVQHLQQALTALPYGHSVFEQVYWPPDDAGRTSLRKLAPRPQRTISNWNVALDGGLMSIEQYAPASNGRVLYGINPLKIPIGRLVVYSRDQDPGVWWGNSLLRPSYKHWLIKDELIRYQAMSIKRIGMGVPMGTAAEGATQDDVDEIADMAQNLRGGDDAGGGLPFGAKMELLAPNGTLPDIGAAIAYHDNMIAIAGLAHFLNLEGGGGSYALASVQEHTFTQSVQTTAEWIRDTATAHIVEDLVDINFGVDEPAPRIVFDEIGSRQDATAAALKMLVEAGLLSPDVLVEQKVRQQLGFPAKPETDDAQSAPPPALIDPAAARTSRRAGASIHQGTLF
ncbi:portal protein [Gordonia phage Blino]|uniref:Portal protein n=1 Tax=Gordonia phage Blino TaxID=2793696 RepID=A0A7T0M0S9_9CAUD|nr:portal protein [Gordonia phage CarolAnn]YP_010114092.1 portal protein [Gordonia phage Blino]AOE44024.1 portal protein [Gordonia phage CarolAnn]QPL13951.1 portal protein [Gordonia phage Blino]